MHNVLDTFTKAQQLAITHHKGPCFVLAGPGSGKTRVITHRVSYLINHYQIPSEQILTITFTKLAALEMKERFLLLCPKSNAIFCTFHSCFYQILKSSKLNYPQQFITSETKERILMSCSKQILANINTSTLKDIEKWMSICINALFEVELPPEIEFNIEDLEKIFNLYQKQLLEQCLVDYDMILIDTYQLLNSNEMIRNKWQKQFRFIQIDECQDMNRLQYEVVKLVAGKDKNIFIVGDDDQSIYRFRGSDISLLKKFTREFEPVTQILLDTNFRSANAIVEASQTMIQENTNRFQKEIRSNNLIKEGLEIKSFVSRDEMSKHVVEALKNAPETFLTDRAIICRTNGEVRMWSHFMRRNKIEYVAKEERISIYDEEWFLDLEAYIRIGICRFVTKDVVRILNKPNRNLNRDDVESCKLPTVLEKIQLTINGMRPYLALKYILNGIGYHKWLKLKFKNDQDKYDEICETIDHILEDSKGYITAEDWLQNIEEDRREYKENKNLGHKNENCTGVNILTMHASKGLEFDTVYLPEINKGKMPRGFLLDEDTIQEERRLLYVAMTRAKSHLEILYIKGTEGHKLQPSVFIEPLLNN